MNILIALATRQNILDEPKTIDMDQYLFCSKNILLGNYCTTAGCIAGHVVAVGKRVKITELPTSSSQIPDQAADLLGLDFYDQAMDLFNPWATDDFGTLIRDAEQFEPGTNEYAQGIAKLIDKAVELWADPEDKKYYFSQIG